MNVFVSSLLIFFIVCFVDCDGFIRVVHKGNSGSSRYVVFVIGILVVEMIDVNECFMCFEFVSYCFVCLIGYLF